MKWNYWIIRSSFLLQQNLKKSEKIISTINDVQSVLKLWRMANLTLHGKTVVFKILGLSKIIFHFHSKDPYDVVCELKNM